MAASARYERTGLAEGSLEMVKLSWVRGVMGGLGSHMAYTGLTGLGFGIARVLRRGVLRWLVVPFFWCLAMFAHFAWNTLTTVFVVAIDPTSQAVTYLVSLPLAFVVLNAPFSLMLVIIAMFVWRHESGIIVKFLLAEPREVVSPDQAESLVPARARMARGLAHFFGRGPLYWWRFRKLERLLIRLAFTRWHHAEDELGWSADEDLDVLKLRREIALVRTALG